MAKKRKRKKQKGFYSILVVIILCMISIFAYRRLSNQSPQYEFSEIPELPEGFLSYGIDISHHQGKIDWETFFEQADTTIRFVYCKATEGVDHVDTQWEKNRAQLLKENMPHGAYHFFLPSKDALEQASHFLKIYSHQQSDLPPVLDIETEGASDEQLIKDAMIWLNHVEKQTGKRPIIYTSYNFYNEKFKTSFSGYKFWVANYNTIEERFKPENIIHWQFSDNGRVPGIKGPVDLNFSKIQF